jgi:hypothetical protein
VAWTRKKKILLIGAGVTVVSGIAALVIAARAASERFEPFLREQTVTYLRERFKTDVDLKALRVRMPRLEPLKIWHSKGRGSIAKVEGDGLVMRRPGTQDVLFSMRTFEFKVDLGSVWEQKPVVKSVIVDGMTINIPPKGQRGSLTPAKSPATTSPNPQPSPKVKIEDILISDAKLVILPRDPKKNPLRFDIAQLRFKPGEGTGMKYDASLTNPKPPGRINATGQFGPWVADDPGDTPIQGRYTFNDADLSVFNAVAGILQSTGEFDGSLSNIHAKGVATVPDFRLKMSGNRVPLKTQFEVMVDGTNGNTTLQPVRATLGSTHFTTSGGIIKHEGDQRRTISPDVNMPKGNIQDLLRLATKGAPFMEGSVNLKTRVDLPPLSGKVRDKLILDGKFDLTNARFLKTNIQDQIDSLSRRGQGQPKNELIDEVVSGMRGVFHLENEQLTFSSLTFGVPGADIDLAGNYNLDQDLLAFRGALKLQAKVSQTMTGWKRWALKPVDPFFAKEGVGTFLKVKVEGTSKQPKFGLDRKKKDAEPEVVRTRKVSTR